MSDKPITALKKLATQARPGGLQSSTPTDHTAAVNARLEELPGVRGTDGRSLRRTGRDVQFNTNVSPELKRWAKMEAVRIGQPIGKLFELMRDAYEREQKKGGR